MSEPLALRLARYRVLWLEELRRVIGNDSAELFAWMRYHLGWEDIGGRLIAGGGKGLRPSLLLLATELSGGPAEQAAPAAAALELVHNFSLLHDDIEDQSRERRGRATVWTVAGTAQAINTGDGMFALARLAMHRLLEAGCEQRRVLEAMRELDEACVRLVEGQYLDIAFETRSAVSRDEYLAMATGKTAACFAASAAIGALLGGASGERVQAFRAFGQHLGLAFQAVDDILGIWGDPRETGKPAGDDLRSRKRTYPVIAALASGGEPPAALAARYAQPASATDDISEITALVEAGGGQAATQAFASEQLASAAARLEAAGVDADARAVCAEFAAMALGRSLQGVPRG